MLAIDYDVSGERVVVDLLTENNSDVVKVIPKNSMDTAHLIDGIRRVDPVLRFRIPSKANTFNGHIIQVAVLLVLCFVLPAETGYQSRQTYVLFHQEYLFLHID